MNDTPNKCIECSVTKCANHCSDNDYCALKKIMVGAHGKTNSPESTDCRSFAEKSK